MPKGFFKVAAYYCFRNDEGEWREDSSTIIVETDRIEQAALCGFLLGERVIHNRYEYEGAPARDWKPYLGCVKVWDWKPGTTDGVTFEPDRIAWGAWEWKCDRGESMAQVRERLKQEMKA